jgi:hypothetical protein
MKPKLEWNRIPDEHEEYASEFLDVYSLHVWENGGSESITGLILKRVTCAEVFKKKFRNGKAGFAEAKAWCESQVPHLIAMYICDGDKDEA